MKSNPVVVLVATLSFLAQVPVLRAQPKRPALPGIAYVELQVSDVKKSVRFYHDFLGYAVTPMQASHGNCFRITVNARQCIIIRDGLPAAQDERLLTLAFETADPAAMKAYLQSAGLQAANELQPASGYNGFVVPDPDKHHIAFVSPVTRTPIPETKTAAPVSARILHAGLTIASAADADRFYKNILGFSETWRGGATDSVTSWINMHVPESTDYLEYMLVTGTVNRKQLGGLHHIALLVPDMQAALDLLNSRAANYAEPVPEPRIGRNRRWQLNLYDPDGTRIELMEPFPMK